MDKDQSPIGGLASPLQPTRQLFLITILMDVVAATSAYFISPGFALCILLYIVASRAYSYRGIRLKKYPIAGFATVFIFQGGFIFYAVYMATAFSFTKVPVLPLFISSLLIGALYPLTQIYQHKDDFSDNVISISYLLGLRGTFLFSMSFFLAATFLFFIRFKDIGQTGHFYLFISIMLPVVLFFLYWMYHVWHNEKAANFKNSLRMNILSTLCTSVFFIILIILNH